MKKFKTTYLVGRKPSSGWDRSVTLHMVEASSPKEAIMSRTAFRNFIAKEMFAIRLSEVPVFKVTSDISYDVIPLPKTEE